MKISLGRVAGRVTRFLAEWGLAGRVRRWLSGTQAGTTSSNELDLQRMSEFRYGGEVISGGRVGWQAWELEMKRFQLPEAPLAVSEAIFHAVHSKTTSQSSLKFKRKKGGKAIRERFRHLHASIIHRGSR